MNTNGRKKKVLIRWFIARLLCLTHLILSIYFLLATKFARHLFFLPVIGSGLIALEMIIFSLLKFRLQCASFLLLTYSIFILSTIWLLELYRINYLIAMRNQQASVEVFSVIYYAPSKVSNDFLLNEKYLWSQIQIQVYVFIIVILKGLCKRKNHKLEVVVQTWTSALDILDFIDLLSFPKLYSDNRFVYMTLSIWSISGLQFIIEIPSIKNILIKRNYHRLASIINYSFISMLITDIPYLIIRLYAIFVLQNHAYTSYFLMFKNVFIIILQTADVWKAFHQTIKKKKSIAFV
jgi:hypothetical protein